MCWSSDNLQKLFFDWLSKQLNIQQERDWYEVKASDITDRGGHFITTQFNGSVEEYVHVTIQNTHVI
jgi:hypothetical protein